MDEKNYNENKDIWAKPDELITISNPEDREINILKNKINNDNDTVLYDCMHQGVQKGGLDIETYIVPSNMKTIYLDDTSYININGKNEQYNLKDGEIYVHKEFSKTYKNLEYIDLPIILSNGKEIIKKYKIKGYFEIEGTIDRINQVRYDEALQKAYGRTMVIINCPPSETVYAENRFEIIYTKTADKILSLLNGYNIEFKAPIQWKNEINNDMKHIIFLESLILVAVYVILGFNIKSIAANTFEKRKYEVSVQRTIGAKKIDIICQYIFESGIVTIIAALISCGIVISINCIYKLIEQLRGNEVVIYLSLRSLIIYTVTCLGIMIFVNFSFAKEVLNVEIIKYLKKS